MKSVRASYSCKDLLLVDSLFYLLVELLNGYEVNDIVDDWHYDKHKRENIDPIFKGPNIDSMLV